MEHSGLGIDKRLFIKMVPRCHALTVEGEIVNRTRRNLQSKRSGREKFIAMSQL